MSRVTDSSSSTSPEPLTESSPEPSGDLRRSGPFILSSLAGGHSLFHWFLQSFIVLLPEVQAAFHLSGVGVGAILTARELAAGLVTLPGGVIADLLHRHWGILLAGCIGVFSLAALAMSLSPVYPLLLVGMAAVAICHSIWHLPAAASLSHHFPQRRGMALSLHGVGGSIGDVIGPVATGALLAFLSWREILSVYAAVPFFLAFLALWSFQNIVGTSAARVETPNLPDRLTMTKALLRNRLLWGLTVVRGLRAMALVAILTVLPLYLGNDLELGTFNRGLHIGLLIAMGLFAKPVAGYLSDRWGRKQVLAPGLVWSCAICLLLIPFGDGIALTALIVLLGLFLYPDQPIVTAAALEIAGRDVATTALGVVSFGGFMMAATSPIIAGFLYETLGIAAALYYVAGLFALAAVIFVVLPLRAPGEHG